MDDNARMDMMNVAFVVKLVDCFENKSRSGSHLGLCVREDGLMIVAKNLSIENCKILAISFQGEEFDMELVHYDCKTGLGLYKAKTARRDFQKAEFACHDIAPWTKLYKVSHEKGDHDACYTFTSGYTVCESNTDHEVKNLEEDPNLKVVLDGKSRDISFLPLAGFSRKKPETLINGVVFDSDGRVVGYNLFSYANLDWALPAKYLLKFYKDWS